LVPNKAAVACAWQWLAWHCGLYVGPHRQGGNNLAAVFQAPQQTQQQAINGQQEVELAEVSLQLLQR
jgi:hypothetical protein